MELITIKNKELWDSLCDKCFHEKTFLQSFNWGVFNEKLNNKVFYFGVKEGNEILGICLVIEIKAKRGTFLHVPHGPLIFKEENKFKVMKFLRDKLFELAKEEGASFVRFSPILQKTEENEKIFIDLDFNPSPIHMHPEVTWVLDISKPESELLYGMRKTTRYLIRQAFNIKELKVRASKNIEDVDRFYDLYSYTAKVQKFTPFSYSYIKNEFEVFANDKKAMIFFAEYKNKPLSTAFILFWKDTIFYHHGASVRSKIPASYLLQWEIIKIAKLSNYKFYNFWGISPVKKIGNKIEFVNEKHPWNGLSLFKMRFGGEVHEYVKTMDLVVSKPKYLFNRLVETLRKKKRGL